MTPLSSTARLARLSAHRPWRAVGVWVLCGIAVAGCLLFV